MYLTLIPKESPFGIQASQLAASLNTDLQTIKEEAKDQPQTFADANPQSNG